MTPPAVPVAHRLRRIAQRQRQGASSSFPVHAQIEICSSCNGRCVYCPSEERRGEHLHADVVSDWILNWAEQGLESVAFHGFGEPLAAQGFADILAAAEQAGSAIELTTNGELLESHADVISRVASRVAVSVDTVDEATAKRLRPGIDLGKVLNGIAALRSAGVPRLEVWTTLTRPMLETLPETVEWAAEAGVDELVIQPLGGPAAHGQLSVNRETASAHLEGLGALAQSMGVRLNLSRVLAKSTPSCSAPACTACLRIRDSRSAYLLPCCNWRPDMPLGVIEDASDLAVVWAQPQVRSVAQAVASGDWQIGCDGCPAANSPLEIPCE